MTELQAKLSEAQEQFVHYEEQHQMISQTFKNQVEGSFTSLSHYEEAKQMIDQLVQLEQQVQTFYQELHTATKMVDLLERRTSRKRSCQYQCH